MNLKRLRGIASGALITIAAALFAGCMNSMAGGVDGTSRMATLQLSATGIPDEYQAQFEKSYPNATRNASGRSITPNAPWKPGDTGLTFYLSGTSETGKKLDDIEVTLVLKTGSTDEYEFVGTVAIDSMSWNLVLTAYTDGATKAEPVLRGYCSVDLRNGSGSATFKLSPEKLSTPGTVKITGKFLPNKNVATYTMGIYKKDSASDKINEASETYSGDGTTAEDFIYTCSSIAPGNYLYKMVFKNADGTITGSFIDTLIVDAGNALNRDLGTLDVVNKKPEPPTDFMVYLENNSESSDETYRVKLNWKSGGGETNFEVELTEYADDGTDATSATKTIYGMASMDTETPKTVEDFQGSDVWSGKGGAMTFGDEEAYFELKLGVVYEVRIRARNYMGTSDWVERVAATGTDTGFTSYGTEKINRMKIMYNLNGGTLKYYNGGAYETKTVNFTEYKTWKGTNLDLLEIDNTNTTTGNNLNKGTSPFVEWRTDVYDAASGITVADYKNLSVTAFFGSSVNASISMADGKKDVELGDITVTYGSSTSGTAAPLTLSGTNTTYDIPKVMGTPTATTKLTIQLSASDATNVYTNIQFELSYNGIQTFLPYDTGTTNQCTLSLDNYVAGKIQVRVIADTANAKSMSQTLTFNLK